MVRMAMVSTRFSSGRPCTLSSSELMLFAISVFVPSCLILWPKRRIKVFSVSSVLRIGDIVYPIDKRSGFLSFRHFSEGFGDCFIGQKHKLLNQVISLFRFLKINAQRLPFFIEIEFYFVSVEIDRTIGKPSFPQLLCQVIQFEYLSRKITFLRFNDCLRILIGEAAVGFDDRTYNA